MGTICEKIAQEFKCDVDTAKKAYNAWETHTYMTDMFDTGKRRKEFFERTITRILHSEADEIHPKMRKMFPRNGD